MHPVTTSRKELLNASGSDDAFRHLIHNIFAFSARMETLRAGLSKMVGLTATEYSILVATGHLIDQGPVFINVLANHLHLSGAFVTLQTNQLAGKNLLTKVKDPKDGRRVELKLTKEAHKILKELSPLQCKINDELFADIGEREFKNLQSLLDLLLSGSEKAIPLMRYLEKQ